MRVESGRPRYGVDLDETVIPQEAGLNERAVSFTKGCYVGQETVARLYYRGKPNRHLRGLRLSDAGRAAATPLRLGEKEVGRARLGRRLARASARSRSRSCAARRRPGDARGRRRRRTPRSSSCRSRLAGRQLPLRDGVQSERPWPPWPRTCSSSPASPRPRTTCGRAAGSAPRQGPIDVTLLHARPAGRAARAARPRAARSTRRSAPGARRACEAEGDRAATPTRRRRRRGLGPAPLRRGDRLDAAGHELALAAARPPAPDRRLTDLPGHARASRRAWRKPKLPTPPERGQARAGAALDAQRDGVPGRSRAAQLLLTRAAEAGDALGSRRAARAPARAGRARAIHAPTSRTSATSSAGSQPPSSRPRRGRRAPPRCGAASSSGRSGSAPQSTTRPPAIQNASKRAAASRVRREHEPRARVGRAQHAAEPAEQRLQPRAPALQPGGALVAALGRRPRAICASTCASSARAAVAAATNSRSACVEPLAVEVRVEVAAGTATGSGPSGRRRDGWSRRGSVRPQWRRPNSELSCSTSSAAAARPRTGPTHDRVARRRARARPRGSGTGCRAGSAGRRSRRRRACRARCRAAAAP